MQYTPEQQVIFDHDPNKHGCILAGPGTGKSSTIIAYIARIRQCSPDKVIRLLTFTRAANGELEDKVISAGYSRVESSTVHSFAISILLSNPATGGFPKPLRIADDWEWKELVKKDLACRLSTKTTIIDKLKNEMSAQWESLAPLEDPAITSAIRSRFMGLWDEHRKIYGYTLLSELPFRLKVALEGNPDLNIGSIDLLAVDEYQDLNACDLACLRLLSQRGVVLIAIGDDDQSIYHFRKAHPAGIRNFPADYNAPRYPLSISHRCGKSILELANFVISGDTGRPVKPALTPGVDNPAGYVRYLVFNRENLEAQGIIKIVKWLHEYKNVPLEEILILVRTGVIAELIKKTLTELNVPYSNPDEALSCLKDSSSRELIGFLRLLINRKDSVAWWALLKITNGIGDGAIGQIYEIARNSKIQFGDAILQQFEVGFSGVITKRNKIFEKVKQISKALEGVTIPESSSWGKWIIEQAQKGVLPIVTEGIKNLLTKVDSWKAASEPLTLGQYVNQIEPLIKDITNSKISGRLRIMTLSSSKGLTVKATIIAGVEDGIIPHPVGDYQEERRLLYVGMTRAQEYLFLTRCRRRTGPTARSGNVNVARTRQPSPFLNGGPISQIDGDAELKNLGI